MYLFLILFITYSCASDCKIAPSDYAPHLVLHMEQFDKGIITLDIMSDNSTNQINFYRSDLGTEGLIIVIILLIIIALLIIGSIIYAIKCGYCWRNPEREHLYQN